MRHLHQQDGTVQGAPRRPANGKSAYLGTAKPRGPAATTGARANLAGVLVFLIQSQERAPVGHSKLPVKIFLKRPDLIDLALFYCNVHLRETPYSYHHSPL